MARVYGEELRQQILETKKRLIEAIENRQRRIDNWETDEDDCFLSERVEQNAISECNMQLKILDGDGMMDWNAIFDENGNEVRVHWFINKWGRSSVVGRGVFASSEEALLKKTGWKKKTIRVPVWTRFSANGGGMYGVYTGSYDCVRWHTNMVTGEYFGYPN